MNQNKVSIWHHTTTLSWMNWTKTILVNIKSNKAYHEMRILSRVLIPRLTLGFSIKSGWIAIDGKFLLLVREHLATVIRIGWPVSQVLVATRTPTRSSIRTIGNWPVWLQGRVWIFQTLHPIDANRGDIPLWRWSDLFTFNIGWQLGSGILLLVVCRWLLVILRPINLTIMPQRCNTIWSIAIVHVSIGTLHIPMNIALLSIQIHPNTWKSGGLFNPNWVQSWKT